MKQYVPVFVKRPIKQTRRNSRRQYKTFKSYWPRVDQYARWYAKGVAVRRTYGR